MLAKIQSAHNEVVAAAKRADSLAVVAVPKAFRAKRLMAEASAISEDAARGKQVNGSLGSLESPEVTCREFGRGGGTGCA